MKNTFLFIVLCLVLVTMSSCSGSPEKARIKLEEMNVAYNPHALNHAVMNNDITIIDWFLKSKFDLSLENSEGYTPLLTAIYHGRSDLLKKFIDAGANVNHETKNGETPLAIASYRDEVEIARMLVESGADIDYISRKGKAAINFAMQNRGLKVFDYLLEKGASTETITKTNEWILKSISDENIRLFSRLIDLKMEINTDEVIHALIEKKNIELIRIAANNGTEFSNKRGSNALSDAVQNGNSELAELYFELGAELNFDSSNFKHSPLTTAYKNDNEHLAKVLRKQGFNDSRLWAFQVADKTGGIDVVTENNHRHGLDYISLEASEYNNFKPSITYQFPSSGDKLYFSFKNGEVGFFSFSTSHSPIKVVVKNEGIILYESAFLDPGEIEHIEVDLKGAKSLTLEVGKSDEENISNKKNTALLFEPIIILE